MKGMNKGFTVIELLVVISIISLLASVILPTLGTARIKAEDAKRINDTQEISKAIYAYFLAKGHMPANRNHWSGVSTGECDGTNCNRAQCDQPLPDVPGGGAGTGYIDASMVAPTQYNEVMQELVDAGYLSSIPHSTLGEPGYCYTDTGPGNQTGAMIVTELLQSTPTTTGRSPSCRPYDLGVVTWCTKDLSQQYCLCNPY